jgi:hypothetical protein
VTIYLSGAISTRTKEQFVEEFTYWANVLRGEGFTVINPIELDEGEYEGTYRDYLARDLKILLETDSSVHDPVERLYLLPSWSDSKGGVFLEMFAAELVDIPIYEAETRELLVDI